MAYYGSLWIGGRDFQSDSKSSIAGLFKLTKASEVDQQFILGEGSWIVEIKKGYDVIVARCNNDYGYNQVLTESYRICQQALDLLSVLYHHTLAIKSYSSEYHIIYKKDKEYILRSIGLAKIGFDISVTVEVKDKYGNIKPPQKPLPPEWIPAFRYYRLSQLSDDLEDAYRNLFLSFESILSKFQRKSKRESETQWIISTLQFLATNFSLDIFKSKDTTLISQISEFVDLQYKENRCRLFHAKNPSDLLPIDDINPELLLKSYSSLLRVWRDIVSNCQNLSIGGGCVTYVGFRELMKPLPNTSYNLMITEDDSPESKNDKLLSPKQLPCYQLKNVIFNLDKNPGEVSVFGDFVPDKLKSLQIYRIGLITDGILFVIHGIKEGLTLSDIDRYEVEQIIQMKNKNTPSTNFDRH
ncbi:hypothetical protein [Methanospirillum sp.]